MFFSVKRPMKIDGKSYIPCICYEANRYLERTVQSLEAQGKAVTYPERVFFQNGKVIEKKSVVKENLTAEKKDKGKKPKKAKAEDFVKEVEEITAPPLNEETDEPEGF